MNTNIRPSYSRLPALALAVLGFLTAAVALRADSDHAGPNGGRVLPAAPLAVEFFVDADRHAVLTFLDAAGVPAAGGAAEATLIAELSDGRLRPELAATATGFRTVNPLPADTPYRIILQLRADADARPQNFRLDLNLHICGECGLAEYACTCEGH